MRVLVVGSGAREHAIAWSLSRSDDVEEIFVAPGNPGMRGVATPIPVSADNIHELADLASSLRIDLTVVGPELPLVLGIGDEFARRSLPLFGPDRAGAQLEGSKVFTKDFCVRHGVPTAKARTAHDQAGAAAAAREIGLPVVLKADGLAAGKGVIVCRTQADLDEALVRFFEDRRFGSASERVLVEECLEGDEVSFMVLTDGTAVVPMATARDYKRLGDGDSGPNTGGMGSVSPAVLPPGLPGRILAEIVGPTLSGLAREGIRYRGVLYAGVMVTREGPKLLEYNCRFGDPETQAVLPRLDGDLLPLLSAVAGGELAGVRAAWKREAAVCVVLAADGYPDSPRRGDVIRGVPEALALPGVALFFAGAGLEEGQLVTAGGRVLSVVARGADVASARAAAYTAAGKVSFEGAQLRRDIGSGM